jgi:hypothetical protein
MPDFSGVQPSRWDYALAQLASVPQPAPNRSGDFSADAVAGLLRGLGNAALGRQQGRAQQSQMAMQQAAARNEANLKATQEQAKARGEFVQGLEKRAAARADQPTLERIKAEADARRAPEPTLARIQAESAARARGTASVKPAAEATDYSGDVETTTGGQQYLDISKYLGKDRTAATNWARQAGVPFTDAGQSDAVRQTDVARLNLEKLQQYITDVLPPDWRDRPQAIPQIKLKQWLQSNHKVASYGSFRTAAINLMRAAAGAKGLRINQAEILQSFANDIPQLTDDLPTAVQRIDNMNQQLDSMVSGMLTKNRAAVMQKLRGGATAPAGKVRMTSPSGKVYEFDASQADSARAHGYR